MGAFIYLVNGLLTTHIASPPLAARICNLSPPCIFELLAQKSSPQACCDLQAWDNSLKSCDLMSPFTPIPGVFSFSVFTAPTGQKPGFFASTVGPRDPAETKCLVRV